MLVPWAYGLRLPSGADMTPMEPQHNGEPQLFAVVLATTRIGTDGPDRVVSLLARTAANEGHRVTVVTGRAEPDQRALLIAGGIQVVELGDTRYPVRALRKVLPR